MVDTSLLVIGAGPYGLAVAAYARHRGIEPTVLGEPMGFWREHMPRGMFLRSGPDWHLDATNVHTFEAYLAERGVDPAAVDPIPVDLFLAYATWFQEIAGLHVRPQLVTALRRHEGAFEADLDGRGTVSATTVVAAPGISHFTNIPHRAVAELPPERFTHTCFLTEVDRARDARTLIIGGRQSAFEWAALLADAGVDEVHVAYRHDTPAFAPADWHFVDPMIDQTVAVPGWFRHLPADQQDAVAQRFWAEGRLKLEPWLTPRMPESVVHRHPRTEVTRCVELPDGDIRAELSTGDVLLVDHVVLATGYRADITAVPYLADLPGLETIDGFPVLDEHMQTSVPGLFLTGFAATHDFGPFFGFVRACPAAAQIIVPELARLLEARAELSGQSR
ncbi:NAD(P)-binding domain-containing protein [Actinomycetospora sp. TBRC 11914]|uniref:NAD(P)-binding domain-containing protein n=1 Tax=Actinomycetospora sp. TBRC 11914 TaxID=2729387 RepID=UPI00145F5105|nr:NAD(P)-binding domain-containing protein [Actinomycetospora sp. TBRC 11914]NMO88245.1 NAD(P)-binding domain-containing protein [Actinomycetospora sp. TBRC 11914]